MDFLSMIKIYEFSLENIYFRINIINIVKEDLKIK